MDLRAKLTGKFIVFDGPDGCGKTTQLRMLEEKLAAAGAGVVLAKDPGGTPIGDRIRSLLLDFTLADMDVRCEAFLFMASRAQLIGQVVEPALRGGKVVLCDRFISSTWAYQGAAGYNVSRIVELGRLAVGDVWPALTFIFDVSPEEGFQRIGRKPGQGRRRGDAQGQGMLLEGARAADAMESRPLAFHRKVRELFLKLPPDYPGQVVVIDGRESPERVHQQVMETLDRVTL